MKYAKKKPTEQERYDASTAENRKQNLAAQRSLEKAMETMNGTFTIVAYTTDSLFGDAMPMLHSFENRLKYVLRKDNWTMAVNIRERMTFHEVLNALAESRGKPYVIDAKTWKRAFRKPRTFRRLPDGSDELYLSDACHGALPLTIYVKRGKPLNLDSYKCVGTARGQRSCNGMDAVTVYDYLSREDVEHMFREKFPFKY